MHSPLNELASNLDQIKKLDQDGSIELALKNSRVNIPHNNEFDNKKAEIEKHLIERDREIRTKFSAELQSLREDHTKETEEKRDFSDMLVACAIEELAIEHVQAVIGTEKLIEEFLKEENKKDMIYYEEKIASLKSIVETSSNRLEKYIDRESLLENTKNLSQLIDDLIKKREEFWKNDTKDLVNRIIETKALIAFEEAIKNTPGFKLNDTERELFKTKLPEFKNDIATTMAQRPTLDVIQEKIGVLYQDQLGAAPSPKPAESLIPEIPFPPPINSTTSTINNVVNRRYELNTEILFAAKAKALFAEIFENKNQNENQDKAPDKTPSQLTLLAAKFTKSLENELKKLHNGVVEFSQGNLVFKQLKEIKESVQSACNKLNNPEPPQQSVSPRRS